MRHQVFGKKLKRNIKERKVLFKGLISSLILKGRIKTTKAKAKAIQGQAEKLVSKARRGTLSVRRQLANVLDKGAVEKLLNEVGPSFSKRQSGFTQMIKIGSRKGDNAPMVLLQWVEVEKIQKLEEKTPEAKEGKEKAEKVATGKIEKSAKGEKNLHLPKTVKSSSAKK